MTKFELKIDKFLTWNQQIWPASNLHFAYLQNSPWGHFKSTKLPFKTNSLLHGEVWPRFSSNIHIQFYSCKDVEIGFTKNFHVIKSSFYRFLNSWQQIRAIWWAEIGGKFKPQFWVKGITLNGGHTVYCYNCKKKLSAFFIFFTLISDVKWHVINCSNFKLPVNKENFDVLCVMKLNVLWHYDVLDNIFVPQSFCLEESWFDPTR